MRRLLVGTVALFVSVGVAASSRVPQDDKAILHVLNRVGFGPRPGDVEKVRAIGLERYIDQQLHPERIPDAALNARLAPLGTIGMSSREIAEKFEEPLLEARREQKQAAKGPSTSLGTGDPNANQQKARAPAQQAANRVLVELAEQKLLRAVYSDRQLQEVLTDFWFNHFNVDSRKGPERFMLTEYERETIRPRVLGSFRDLLEATAKSPAMLFYLDNWMSADPNGPHVEMTRARPMRPRFGAGFPPMPRPQPQGKNTPKGLNENYGRELMELHTLGVDGGYTQQDVTEVARAFTGWTIQNPRQGGGFVFNARLHDPGEKMVLGHRLVASRSGGGMSDGEQVLDLLASHPSTATFIATKLTRRFVSDTPPQPLVDRVAARFRATNGDLREVMRTILTSPEFLSPEVHRAKVKTPFEFVTSAVRATAASIDEAQPLVRALQQLGMPLYQCQPPTGYKDTADAWVNTGALVGRMNFAVSLANNQLRGIVVRLGSAPDGSPVSVGDGLQTVPQGVQTVPRETVTHAILAGDISDATKATIAKASSPEQMAALTLGSPEFQRR